MDIKCLNGDVYVPKILGGSNCPKDSREGGGSNTNNPYYLRF